MIAGESMPFGSRLRATCSRVSEIITSWGLEPPKVGDRNLEATVKIAEALEWATKRIALLEWQIRDMCGEPRDGIEIPT